MFGFFHFHTSMAGRRPEETDKKTGSGQSRKAVKLFKIYQKNSKRPWLDSPMGHMSPISPIGGSDLETVAAKKRQ
jgi:hypothetical protein